MTGAQLREMFLKYFEDRGHVRVASSSLVPAGDATLLFTNAGMVQFKGVFTGAERRPYSRATTSQKCLRVSGKHNDLENVGHTARHHTFFEMLGNFSFGDYFKEDAIVFGWEFLTKHVGLPEEKLHVTVYKDDDEALELWRKVTGRSTESIQRLGEKDNFWSMGETGPCGPCSEIHIDQGGHVGCGRADCGPECDCDRFLELWNLVFMQFERDGSGTITPLPKPSIDTGLGLERLAATAQGFHSNWESDLFRPIIGRVEELSGIRVKDHDMKSIAVRVIADHARAAAFLITDGVLPSNDGRGYVLRRILRRAIRYGKLIGLNKPFLYDASDVAATLMAPAYPELEAHRALVSKVVRAEEERFLETLGRGLILFEEEARKVRNMGRVVIPGDVVFRLYDTFGFPPDLTADLAQEAGMEVDEPGFHKEMAVQKEKARRSWTDALADDGAGGVVKLANDGICAEFTGYGLMEDVGGVRAMWSGGERITEASVGAAVDMVTDRTPFYGESGGQIGDTGAILGERGRFEVETTLRPLPHLIVHRGKVTEGSFTEGERVSLVVDAGRRKAVMANHTATHLLQYALREALGDHVKQSGSLVESTRLRFDFTHFSQITADELTLIEDLVNDRIRENLDVVSHVMSLEDARAAGATALFGEKYGDSVRVISIGDFSKELCGGVHVSRTGDIGLFKTLSEGGIAAGVRRVEAVTGKAALDYVRSLETEIKAVADTLRGSRGEIAAKLDRLIEEKKSGEREIQQLKTKLTSSRTGDILDGLKEAYGVKVLAKVVEDVSGPKDLRQYADRVKERLGSGVALLGATHQGKAMIIAIVTKDLTERFHAGEIVKKAAARLGGAGGGRPDMAQAGGPDVDRLQEVIATVEKYLL